MTEIPVIPGPDKLARQLGGLVPSMGSESITIKFSINGAVTEAVSGTPIQALASIAHRLLSSQNSRKPTSGLQSGDLVSPDEMAVDYDD